MAEGDGEAHQAVMEFDGQIRIHGGYLPIIVEGYPLPWPDDVERLESADVERMPVPALEAERRALVRVLAARLEMMHAGVSQVWLMGTTGARTQTVGEWLHSRLRAIDARLASVGGGVA